MDEENNEQICDRNKIPHLGEEFDSRAGFFFQPEVGYSVYTTTTYQIVHYILDKIETLCWH